MQRLLAAAVLGLAMTAASLGRADLPPPDGRKYVDYAFKVESLAKFSDYVLLAYPYSLSNGAPTVEHVRLEDGKPTGVGRRSGLPKLYAMKKQAYEQWLESYKPAQGAMEDPALDALFKGDKVVACNATLTPSFELDSSDPRSVVIQSFRAKAIDDKTCQLEPVGAPPTKVASSEPASSPSAPAKGGCAGCATVPVEDPNPSVLVLLGALVLGAARLRKKPARSHAQ